MDSEEERRVQHLLEVSESDYNSDLSIFDDSDDDPNFCPPTQLPKQTQMFNLSDDDNSVELTSSDDSSGDVSDTDSWCDILENIPDFSFDASHSGVKINVQGTARNNPVEIFETLWTKEIYDIIVRSTNNYSENSKNKNRPHSKNARAVKFPSVRDFFSNNPLYCHPIAKHVMSGRRFEQLLNCFSVDYISEDVILDGPMKKINPLFDKLVKNFQNAFFLNEQLSFDESLLLH
ncbi:hypothetical protein QTP88_010762 [Uroleucon formosanum]